MGDDDVKERENDIAGGTVKLPPPPPPPKPKEPEIHQEIEGGGGPGSPYPLDPEQLKKITDSTE
jgi:hypothetical protein